MTASVTPQAVSQIKKPAITPIAFPKSGVGMKSARKGIMPTATAVKTARKIGSCSLADFIVPLALTIN